jgi:hypothetical protein
MHTRLKIPVWRRNLAHRPAAPALGNGRVQRLAQRALLVLGGKATTSQVIEWTCCRKRLLHGRRIGRTTIAPLVLRSNELRSVSGGEARAVGRGFGGCEMSELGSTIGSGEQRCLAKLLASREELPVRQRFAASQPLAPRVTEPARCSSQSHKPPRPPVKASIVCTVVPREAMTAAERVQRHRARRASAGEDARRGAAPLPFRQD